MNEPGRRTQERARALWYVGRGRAELRSAPLSPPAPADALVRTAWSALSRGTERLVFEGRVAAVESERMRAPMQEGDFPFPVKYGYCAVGTVEEGPGDLVGRTVFALHPHQDLCGAGRKPCPRAASRAGAARRARRQHGNGAERGLGFGRRAGRSDPRRWGRCGRAPRRLDRGAAAGGGGHDGRRRSVARRHRPPSWLRLPEAARRARRRGPRLPRERDRGRTCLRLGLRRPRGVGRRAELVRRRRGAGAARAFLPQPPAAAGVVAGRRGRAVAPPALDAPAPARQSPRASRRRSPRRADHRRGRVRGSSARAAALLAPDAPGLATVVRYDRD